MGAVTNFQPGAHFQPLGLQTGYFIPQAAGMDNHSVAYHPQGPWTHQPGGNKRQFVAHSVDHHGVPSVGSAVEAGHHGVLITQQVNNLAFGFIAPLQANHTTDHESPGIRKSGSCVGTNPGKPTLAKKNTGRSASCGARSRKFWRIVGWYFQPRCPSRKEIAPCEPRFCRLAAR